MTALRTPGPLPHVVVQLQAQEQRAAEAESTLPPYHAAILVDEDAVLRPAAAIHQACCGATLTVNWHGSSACVAGSPNHGIKTCKNGDQAPAGALCPGCDAAKCADQPGAC